MTLVIQGPSSQFQMLVADSTKPAHKSGSHRRSPLDDEVRLSDIITVVVLRRSFILSWGDCADFQGTLRLKTTSFFVSMFQETEK